MQNRLVLAAYAEHKAHTLRHRQPMVSLIYEVVADILRNAPESEEEEAA